MTPISLIFIISLLFLLEIAYFKIAAHFNVVDKPNERSSHTTPTIRGGGVIFALSALIFFCRYGFQNQFFILGLLLIAIISFLDDVYTLNNKIRLTVHLIAVLLLMYQWDLFNSQWYWLFIAGIFVIATINAYNFMDGINGITGAYSLLAIATLYYINQKIIAFTSSDFLIITGLSLLVFNFFNFRKRAKCFAGDVGSVSMSFILIFLIGQLILKTGNFAYILLLFVYGLDTAVTVFFRKIRKENIFEAHRSHFYQYLANQLKWPHLAVATLYVVLQLAINVLIISFASDNFFAIALFVLSTLLFVGLRFLIEGKEHLLGHKTIH